MRHARLLLTFALFAFAFAFASHPASAQTRADAPACSGKLNIIRVSEIKPGMKDTFLKAVAAQQAWYKSRGTDDVITVEQTMEFQPTPHFVDNIYITTHTSTPNRANPPQDDGYKAFVALFNQSSTISKTYYTCQAK